MDRVLKEVSDRWNKLSLVEQMINIGNEVKRAIRVDMDNEAKCRFLDKAISYTDLTIADPKNKKVIPELLISKDVLEDYRGEHKLNYSRDQLRNYYGNYIFLL